MDNDAHIRKIFLEEFTKNFRSGNPQIPPHTHNGIDNLRIHQSDVILNKKVVLFGTLTAGITKLKFLSNPSSFVFYGFAANGGKRAIVNGNAELGACTTVTSIDANGTIAGTSSPFIQMSNYSYSDSAGPSFQVGSSAIGFAYVNTGSATVVEAAITDWNGSTITLNVTTLASGWQLTGAFLVI